MIFLILSYTYLAMTRFLIYNEKVMTVFSSKIGILYLL